MLLNVRNKPRRRDIIEKENIMVISILLVKIFATTRRQQLMKFLLMQLV